MKKKLKWLSLISLPIVVAGCATPFLVSCSNSDSSSNSSNQSTETSFDDNVVKPSEPIKVPVAPEDSTHLGQNAIDIVKEKYTAEMLKSDFIEYTKEMFKQVAPNIDGIMHSLKISVNKKGQGLFDIKSYADIEHNSFYGGLIDQNNRLHMIKKFFTQNYNFLPVLIKDSTNSNVINVYVYITTFVPIGGDGYTNAPKPSDNQFGIFVQQTGTYNGVTQSIEGWSSIGLEETLIQYGYKENKIFNSYKEAAAKLNNDIGHVVPMKSLPISFEIK